MMWFETLTGFPEVSPQQVRENITVYGTALRSRVNGKVLVCGQLEIPSLAELRERVHSSGHEVGKMSIREVVANVQHLHTNESNAGSLFQVASQFNLLEMASPGVTPDAVWEFMRMIVPRDQRVLSRLVRERFIETTLQS